MGKKKKEEMEKNRAIFLYGDEEKNIPGVQKLGKDVQKASNTVGLNLLSSDFIPALSSWNTPDVSPC
mgnify:CR=1 FL=1